MSEPSAVGVQPNPPNPAERQAAAMFELDVRSTVGNVIDQRLRKLPDGARRYAVAALSGVGYEVYQAMKSAGLLAGSVPQSTQRPPESPQRSPEWPEWVTSPEDLFQRAENQHSDQCPCDGDCYIALTLAEIAALRSGGLSDTQNPADVELITRALRIAHVNAQDRLDDIAIRQAKEALDRLAGAASYTEDPR